MEHKGKSDGVRPYDKPGLHLNLTPDDMDCIRQIISNSIEHSCIHKGLTPERVDMLISVADLGIEVKTDSIKGVKKTLKWVLLLIGLSAIGGALIAPAVGLWSKIKAVIGQ
jgi:hypothetical protein